MDNEVMTFVSTEFGTVRTIKENSKIMFCGKDVAAALGYRDTVNALKMHCNRITLEGDEKAIRRMLEQIQNDEFGLGTIDFNKIIPMPDSVYQGDLGAREMTLYGKNNWYDWSIANWDTKWNAYGYAEGTDYSHEEALTFQTAWSAPHAVLEKLSEQFPKIEITHEWADEDIGMNCGRRMYSGGERCEEYVPESEKEAVEFAEGVWGFSGDDFQESEVPTME